MIPAGVALELKMLAMFLKSKIDLKEVFYLNPRK